MKIFFRGFLKQLPIYLNPTQAIKVNFIGSRLFCQLKKTQGLNYLISILKQKTSDPFKMLRRLSVVHILMLQSKLYYPLIEQHLTLFLSKDNWMNENVLLPYFIFLKKCCSNEEQYSRIDNHLPTHKEEVFQMLFYSINTLKLLFKVVSKMPFLGRYYLSVAPQACNLFIQLVAMQAQKLYNTFKMCLNLILNNLSKYIADERSETIVKEVLKDDLMAINEEMKKLFLDKYFYPLGKGIGVKLFRPQDQSPQLSVVIKRIVNNHQETQRKKQRELLQNNLFPNDAFNFKYFQETLQQANKSLYNDFYRQEEVAEIQKNINNYEQSIEGKQILQDTNTQTYDKVI